MGHGDTGKTTFAEHALFAAGAISRAGAVPDGTTVCDWEVDETEVTAQVSEPANGGH